MPLGRRQQVATVGVAAVATALSLAACSSRAPRPRRRAAALQRAAHPRRAAAPPSAARSTGADRRSRLTFQQAAIQAFKSIQSGMTVNYGGRRLGQGAYDLASRGRQLRGLGLADPCLRGVDLQGQDGALLPRRDRPDHPVVQPVRPQQAAAADRRRSSRTSSRARSPRGTTRRSRRITPVSPCPAPRSPSAAAPTPRAPPQNFSVFLVKDAAPSVWTLGSSSTIKWPATSRGGSGNGGVASDRQVHPRGHRVRGLRRRQGLRADLRFGQEQGRQLRRAVADVGLRRRRPRSPSRRTLRSRGLGDPARARTRSLTSRGFWSTRPSRTRTTRRCSRLTSATWSETARNCCPAWATRRCPPASTRWPRHSSAR